MPLQSWPTTTMSDLATEELLKDAIFRPFFSIFIARHFSFWTGGPGGKTDFQQIARSLARGSSWARHYGPEISVPQSHLRHSSKSFPLAISEAMIFVGPQWQLRVGEVVSMSPFASERINSSLAHLCKWHPFIGRRQKNVGKVKTNFSRGRWKDDI